MASLLVHRHLLRIRAAPQTRTVPPEALAGDLATVLAETLRAGDPGRSGLWCIRRLDVRLAVSAAAGRREVARSLAHALLKELDRVTAEGATDPDVLWFRDRAAFLARWVADLARGRTEGRWEYRRLEVPGAGAGGSAAVAARATEEPEALLLALRRLPPNDLDALLGTLTPGDAATTVHALAVAPAGAWEDAVAAARVTRDLLESGRLPTDQRRATLAVVVSGNGAPGAVSGAHARDLVVVAFALRACGLRQRDQLIRALLTGDWVGVARLGSEETAAALASWPEAERVAAVDALTDLKPAAPRDEATEADPAAGAQGEPQRAHTELGAIFLLLPLLADLPFATATEDWPSLAGAPADAGLALLAIMGVFGEDRAPAVLVDPWLRLALGLPEPGGGDLDAEAVAGWIADVGPLRLDSIREAFAAVLVGREEAAAADLADPSLLVAGLLDPAAAAGVRVASCALLRELASRLPGMTNAGAQHLRTDVLALDAHLTIEATVPRRIVVELGHAPLGILLSISGLDRGTFTLGATGDLEWVLTSAR
jgi:hypothetical protein